MFRLTRSNPARRTLLAGLAALATCGGMAFAVPALAQAQAASPLLTILDGDAFLLRDSAKLAAAEGIVLKADDVLELPAPARLARLEFADGLSLAFGTDSRVLVGPRLAGDRAGARIYLLRGWAKLNAPKGVKATVLTAAADVSTTGGTVVMSVQPSETQVFAEAGEAGLKSTGAAAQTLKGGELWTLAADAAKPELANRPTQAFVSKMPLSFMDTLPARAAKFQGRTVEPRKLGPLLYADAQLWLDAEPALRRASLPRWRALARDAEFRRGLTAGLKSHPEWGPILTPPPAAATAPRPYKATP